MMWHRRTQRSPMMLMVMASIVSSDLRLLFKWPYMEQDRFQSASQIALE